MGLSSDVVLGLVVPLHIHVSSPYVFFCHVTTSNVPHNDHVTTTMHTDHNSPHHLKTMRKGPNDMSHIVWALGKFFIYFLCVFFFVFNGLHRYYRFSKDLVEFNTGNNDNNGPKQRVLCCLGPW